MSVSFREILVLIVGSTPQVVTETIYALSQQSPPIHPDEIHIITTAPCRRRIEETLIDGGILERFCTEYALPPIRLTDDSFIVLLDRNGAELDDIRTVEANEAAGDQVAHFVRQKAAEPNCRLHCSLSGGRKSMSYYMGVAFQLFARQWDKLYHVLVSPEFELNEHFFYKPKANQRIEARYRDGSVRHLETDNAEITLIELPLIFLRDKITVGGNGVREMVFEGQKHIDAATVQQPLRINLAERRLTIGGTPVKLAPVQLMIYAAFLRRKLQQTCDGERTYCFECHGCFVPIGELSDRATLEAMVADYDRMHANNPFKREDLLVKWKHGFEEAHLRQNISKINQTLAKQLPDPTLLPIYKIESARKYAHSRYGIRIEKEHISFV
jgi:CRISPR-associated protein Csx14